MDRELLELRFPELAEDCRGGDDERLTLLRLEPESEPRAELPDESPREDSGRRTELPLELELGSRTELPDESPREDSGLRTEPPLDSPVDPLDEPDLLESSPEEAGERSASR